MSHIRGALMFASLTSEGKFGQINWSKGKEILDMKAIRAVTRFIGKKKKKMESKLGLQDLDPAVFLPEHGRQLQFVSQGQHHLRFALRLLAPPLPHPGSHALFFLRVLFGRQPLSPKAVISYLQSTGGLHRCRSSCLSGFQPKACPPH